MGELAFSWQVMYISQYSGSLQFSTNLLGSFRDFFFPLSSLCVKHFHNPINKSPRKLKVIYTQVKASNEKWHSSIDMIQRHHHI